MLIRIRESRDNNESHVLLYFITCTVLYKCYLIDWFIHSAFSESNLGHETPDINPGLGYSTLLMELIPGNLYIIMIIF